MKKFKPELVNFILYTLLLIITPFLMLQNYLQTAIGRASRAAFSIGEISVPYAYIVLGILIIVFLIFFARKLNRKRGVTLIILIALYLLGQNTSDYYFGHRFYDLQYNWHFIAYGLFSYLAFRRFSVVKRSTASLLRIIFISALSISTFDEVVQIFISDRVFDLSDIAKDFWGALLGVVFIFFFIEEGQRFENLRFRQPRIKQYFTNPFSVLGTGFIFAYSLLFFSSLLTETKYIVPALLWSFFTTVVIIFLIHIGKTRTKRWIIRIAVMVVIIYVAGFMFFSKPKVHYVSSGLIVYNNIPVVYFDCLIFPGGMIRPVDKKIHFNLRDQQKLDDLKPDILLIATGSRGQGGKGWNDMEMMEMRYNLKNVRVCQIIKQKTPVACETYNRLIREKKRVLFVIHNS